MDVVLDIDPPALRSLTIEGRLSFSDALDIGLETEWIYVRGGELAIGSEERPHTRTATITLTDTIPDENINTMGDRGIMLMRGTLNLHGNRTNTWSKLSATAAAGATSIEVLDAKNDDVDVTVEYLPAPLHNRPERIPAAVAVGLAIAFASLPEVQADRAEARGLWVELGGPGAASIEALRSEGALHVAQLADVEVVVVAVEAARTQVPARRCSIGR